ncbi:hypothetical protein TUM20984_34550 [Mycobacterium antarcticum]|nr:hypothetical protein TUM20984_34550 [Mycolicibacterium sp. TUM20984]
MADADDVDTDDDGAPCVVLVLLHAPTVTSTAAAAAATAIVFLFITTSPFLGYTVDAAAACVIDARPLRPVYEHSRRRYGPTSRSVKIR